MKVMTQFISLLLLSAFSVSVGATELNIAVNDRFASGSYGDIQNMFVSYPYSEEWDGKMSCGINLWVPTKTVDGLFSNDHDGQFFYLSKSNQTLPLVKFDSALTPYSGEECIEYSQDTLPEDVYCVRTRPVSGKTSSFTMTFQNKNILATIACSKSGDLTNTSIIKMDQDLAKSVVKKMLTVKIK